MNTAEEAGTSSSEVENSHAPELITSKYVAEAKKLIHRKMLVGIKDGRFFVGNFYCIDKQGNIILQDAIEYRSTRRTCPSPMDHRGVGLILIPSSCRTSCHIDCSVEEQLSLLSLKV